MLASLASVVGIALARIASALRPGHPALDKAEGGGTAYSRGNWTPPRRRTLLLAGCLSLLAGLAAAPAATISGELKQWHKAVLDFTGPSLTEASATYLNYRLDVTFTHSATGTIRVIPGFFAADGNAGESSATAGTTWRVNFMPDQTGVWNYSVSFRTGSNVAIDANPLAGSGGAFMNGETGSFTVTASDKSGKDFRAPTMGKLIYTGKSYPEWMGNGSALVTAACNSPEVFLEFNDFDGTPTTDRPYTNHVADWTASDPTWKGTKGKGIIGVVNYLSSIGINSHYFLTMNIEGDGKQAFPYINDQQASRTVFDVSKLAQWGVVFEHMMAKGIQVQFVLTECENQNWFEYLDGTAFGNSRKLYYREMVARFGHLNAVTWNVGEENGWDRSTNFSIANTTAQRTAFAEHLQILLPHADNIAVHNGPSSTDAIFTDLVGQNAYRGVSFQGNFENAVHGHDRILKWRTDSAIAGRPWIVSYDEPFSSSGTPNLDTWRKNSCWAAFTAGAASVGYYKGGGGDLTVQDYRVESSYWNTLTRARDFFGNHVNNVTSMNPADSLVSTGWCLANPGFNYVIYLPNGGSPTLNLAGQSGTFTVKWFDPRIGGSLQNGTVTSVSGGGIPSLGAPPSSTTSDWAILLQANSVDTVPNITTTALVNGERDSAYNQSVNVSLGNAPFTWSIVSGSMPPGFSLAATTGTIGGSTAVAGTYNFTIRVVDADGDNDQQALSVTVNALKAQTITFPVISDQLTTTPTVNLNATASSGLAILYTVVSGPATLSGSTLTLTGAGSVTVRASQAGNATYAAAPAESRSFNVTAPSSVKLYNESGGVVVFDIESQPLPEGWAEKTTITGSTASIFGSCYIATVNKFPSTTGFGMLSYKIVITTPGEYQLQWRSRITDLNFGVSTETTEHNDTFARMLNTSGTSMPAFGPVPGWTTTVAGKDAIPDKTGDNWYKVYTNNPNWSWDAKNQDNAPLPVYWNLAAGTYTFQISVRSAGHAIDRILLWNRAGATAYGNKLNGGGNTAAANGLPLSTITGGGTPPPAGFSFIAVTDFPSITGGAVPYYKDTVRNALAIDASVVANRDKYAQATATFTGATGTYTPVISAMGETDGECSYRFLKNGIVIGTLQNARVSTDYGIQQHSFPSVTLTAGDVIGVESNAVTNGLIAEGTGTAYARGRWTTLTLSSSTGGPVLLAQTITFPVVGDQVMTNPTVNLTATASSGLAVTYSVVSGPATVSGSTVTLTGVGTVTVRASQAGNGTYSAATSLDQTFSVTSGSSGSSVTVNSVHDAYLENGTRYNTTGLRVQNATSVKRVSYLQFTVPALSGTPSVATLVLTEGVDPSGGTMTIRAYAGAANTWTETTLSTTNAPAKGSLLDTFTGNITDGGVVSFNVGAFITGPGTYSFVIEADPSTLDVSFVSKESTPSPSLIISVIPFAETFEAWKIRHGVTDTGESTSIPPLVAYAMGIEPDGDGAQIPHASIVAQGETSYLTLIYTQSKNADNVVVIAETSDDLKSWNIPPSNFITLESENSEVISYKLQIPMQASSQFIRFKAIP